ncbi:MAG: hypothetical protein NVS2B12_25610 [Ktedonobacteraceae bacterium]
MGNWVLKVILVGRPGGNLWTIGRLPARIALGKQYVKGELLWQSLIQQLKHILPGTQMPFWRI